MVTFATAPGTGDSPEYVAQLIEGVLSRDGTFDLIQATLQFIQTFIAAFVMLSEAKNV